jgi:MFS family permease
MRWLIVSGAIHNFNLYALSAFITPYLMRFHELDIQNANFVSTIIYGVMGVPGLFFSGVIGDAARKRRVNAPLIVTLAAILLSIPFFLAALGAPAGSVIFFLLMMGTSYGLMCFYYSLVYSTIQEVVEPSLRGTAISIYFFAMYVLGASVGPYVTGILSDFFTKRAAQSAGVFDSAQAALEPFRAAGLHSAMYLIPILSILLTLVLFAASRTVTKDIEKLQAWMKQSVKA